MTEQELAEMERLRRLSHVQALNIESSQHTIDALIAARSGYETTIEDQQQEIERLSDVVARDHKQIRWLQVKVQSKRAIVAGHEATILKMEDAMKGYEATIQEKQKEIDAQKDHIRRLEEANAELRTTPEWPTLKVFDSPQGVREIMRLIKNIGEVEIKAEQLSERLNFAETFITSIGVKDHYNWARSLEDARS